MRLRKHAIWLAGALLAPHRALAQVQGGGGGAGLTTSPNRVITFDDIVGDVGGKFIVFTSTGQQVFRFSSNNNITLGGVYLKQGDQREPLGSYVDSGLPAMPSLTTSSSTVFGVGGSGALPSVTGRSHLGAGMVEQDQVGGRTDSSGNSGVNMTVNTVARPAGGLDGTIFIPNMISHNAGEDHSIPGASYGKALYLEIDWSQGAMGGGKSFSRWFAVSTAASAALLGASDPRLQSSDQDPAQPEATPAQVAASSSNPSQAGAPSATSSAGTASLSSSGSAPAPASGLALGAIVGIAVGCGVAALAIAAALIFFFMRRRRRAAYHDGTMMAAGRPYDGGPGAHHRTTDLIEKEATAGVNDTPQSPYSDDGQPVHADPSGAGAAAAAAAGGTMARHSDLDYTPYSDRRSTATHDQPESYHVPGPGSEHMRSGSSGGAATPGGRYAHLVEDGMTPDEIARIEEEERQLDAAIERAARH